MAGAGTAGAFTALQRSAGNRAVRDLASGASMHVLQRVPAAVPAPTGLRTSKPVNEYAREAFVALTEAPDSMPINEFAIQLVALANKQLARFGVPAMTPLPQTLDGANAKFEPDLWMILIDLAKIDPDKKVSTVGDLTFETAAHLAGTIYHEARHAEQTFRVMRMLAADRGGSTKPDPLADELRDEYQMSDTAVTAEAVKAPLANVKANARERVEATEWEAITIGRHSAYLSLVDGWLTSARAVAKWAKNATPETIDHDKVQLDYHFHSWVRDDRLGFMDQHTVAIITSTMTEGDRVVLGHMQRIAERAKPLLDAWKELDGRWNALDKAAQVKEVKQLLPAMSVLASELFSAYGDQPNEHDAFGAGDAARDEFLSYAPRSMDGVILERSH